MGEKCEFDEKVVASMTRLTAALAREEGHYFCSEISGDGILNVGDGMGEIDARIGGSMGE